MVLVTAVAVVYRRASYSALPIFLFWFVIMFLIWLFLLGMASVFSGTFTPVEVALTVTSGLAAFPALGRRCVKRLRLLGNVVTVGR